MNLLARRYPSPWFVSVFASISAVFVHSTLSISAAISGQPAPAVEPQTPTEMGELNGFDFQHQISKLNPRNQSPERQGEKYL